MPRETKAKKIQREKQESFDRWNDFWLSYHERLTAMVWSYAAEFRALDLPDPGFRVEQFRDPDGTWYRFTVKDNVWVFPANLQAETDRMMQGHPVNNQLIWSFDQAESEVQIYRNIWTEELRKRTVKQQALDKLNEEEKRLLGL